MKSNTTRVLAVAVLTGGFTIFGASAAQAIDLPDLGGTESGGLLGNGGLLGTGIDLGGTTSPTPPPTTDPGLLGNGGLLGTGIDLGGGTGSIVDDLTVGLPVNANGVNVALLPSSGDGLALGDGVLLGTGTSNLDILSQLGIDTSGLVSDNDLQGAVIGVPLDVSNTWVSILGTGPNGVVVVPTVSSDVSAELDGLLGGVVDVPIDISCTSVTVLSDYENECAGSTPGGNGGGLLGGDLLGGDLLGGDLLGGDILDGDLIDGNLLDGEILGDVNGDGQITIEDRQLDVLGGDTIGDGLTLDGDGVLVDFDDDAADGSTNLGLGNLLDTGAGDPLNLSNTWLSALGGNEGIVIVPDLTLDLSLLTGGLISHEILAPIVIDCVTITVLSDFERDCASGPTDPEDPTDPPTVPEEPTTPILTPVPGGQVGGAMYEEGDAVGGIFTNPCAVVPAVATTDVSSQPVNLAAFGAAALAGAVLAVLLMLLGRRLRRQQQQ